MVDTRRPAGPGRWHQALAYALTGRAWPELGRQEAPDLAELGARLTATEGADALRRQVQETLVAGHSWPHRVPDELMSGLGYAQFAAALTRLRSDLGLDGTARVAPRAGDGRPPSAEERRLLEDVPPHHGT